MKVFYNNISVYQPVYPILISIDSQADYLAEKREICIRFRAFKRHSFVSIAKHPKFHKIISEKSHLDIKVND